MPPYIERASTDRTSGLYPGFYRVRIGLLIEVGDQYLDEQGRPCPFSLEQVGRQVTPELVVLRVDRRKHWTD